MDGADQGDAEGLHAVWPSTTRATKNGSAMDSVTARTSTSTAESMKATMATDAAREREEPLAGDVRPGPGLAEVAGRDIRLGGEGVEDAGREDRFR